MTIGVLKTGHVIFSRRILRFGLGNTFCKYTCLLKQKLLVAPDTNQFKNLLEFARANKFGVKSSKEVGKNEHK